jgi:tetratricopeptide (TPR) repeat protein
MSKFANQNKTLASIEPVYRNAEQLLNQGQLTDALAQFQSITKQQPKWAFGYYGIGAAYASMGQFEDARKQLRKALNLNDQVAAFHAKMAEVLNWLDDTKYAIDSIDQAIKLDPNNTHHIVDKATYLRASGDTQSAYELLHDQIDKNSSDHLLVRVYASLCGSLNQPQAGIDLLKPLTEPVQSDPIITATHYFVLSTLYNQIGDYDNAYLSAKRGSELRNDQYNPQQREDLLIARKKAWSPEVMENIARSRMTTSQPVFIVGMPRSGTSLVEQIIASHPSAYGCGELTHIQKAFDELVSNAGPTPDLCSIVDGLKTASLDRIARRILKEMEKQAKLSLQSDPASKSKHSNQSKFLKITDKMPLNFQHLGFIEQLFPNAKIIHCTRHVLDNFVSCYLLDFAGINNHSYTYDPTNFAHFYGLYQQYMEHWKTTTSLNILDISYEDLVVDQRAKTEELLAFLDLEWDDQCLRFFETKRSVNTASVEQVRQKIYTSSSSRWKNFESHLTPLIDALNAIGVTPPTD